MSVLNLWTQSQATARHAAHFFRRKRFSLRFTLAAVLVIIILGAGLHASSKFGDSEQILDSFKGNDQFQPFNDFEHRPDEFSNAKLTNMIKQTMDEIKKYSPEIDFDRSKQTGCDIGDIGILDTNNFHRLTEHELEKCMFVSESVQHEMESLHKQFQQTLLSNILPAQHEKLYSGEGIVIAAGGKFTLIALPAIKAIRKNGSKNIPIEIMMPPEDSGEAEFCNNVLPHLDPSGLTKCVMMDKIFDKETLKNVKGYQLKAFAILASSFEKVLLLDADNYVVNSIEKIFDSEVFEDRGLILWPDYWRRLHHPKIYDITGITVNRSYPVRNSVDNFTPAEAFAHTPSSQVAFHDLEGTLPDGGTESGQLLVDKSKHLDTIILSLYYNYNGPNYYYPLLGQGYAGEGDKDTFALAAYALSAQGHERRFYQVKSPVSSMGHWASKDDEIRLPNEADVPFSEKQFRGVAMLQHDYVEDYGLFLKAQNNISATTNNALKLFEKNGHTSPRSVNTTRRAQIDFWEQYKENDYNLNEAMEFFKGTRVSFVHSHLPKFEPWEWATTGDMMFDGKKAYKNHKDDTEFKPNGVGHYRMYSDNFHEFTNYDLELANFICFSDFICKDGSDYKNFSYLVKQVNEQDNGIEIIHSMCEYIQSRVSDLTESTWVGSIR